MASDRLVPKVTIIITYYNQLQYVTKSLESAIKQDYPNLEIVISDDHSELHPFPRSLITDIRIKYFRNEKNLGKSANYRKALFEYATGHYALLLNGDDYLTDQSYISKGMDIHMRNENTALVFAKIQTLIESSQLLIEDRCNENLPEIIDGNKFFLDYPNGYRISHLTCLFDRHHAMDLNCYRFNMLGEDWESFLRMMQNKKIGFVNHPIGVRRKHATNATKLLSIQDIDTGFWMIESPFELARSNQIASKARLEEWRNKMLLRYFYKYYVKLHFLNPDLKLALINLFQSKYPSLHKQILNDTRYLFFRTFINNKPVMKFIFKYIIKQPAFLEDMIASRNYAT